jgi:hypothetical protein
MASRIIRSGKRSYLAEATPHFKNEWRTPEPIGLRQLIAELEGMGCHQQDIGDALHTAGPEWLKQLD